MTNFILLLGIFAVLIFAIYDQAIMPKRKGKTYLSIPLQRQAKADVWILAGLIGLAIAQGIQTGIETLTLYLLGFSILLCFYAAFWRTPRLLLKKTGFFFGNLFFEYQHIVQINLANAQILVIDLQSSRRLLVRIQQPDDVEKVVQFFGGYKKEKSPTM